jgi:F-type H+-transporting ATPase subunit a
MDFSRIFNSKKIRLSVIFAILSAFFSFATLANPASETVSVAQNGQAVVENSKHDEVFDPTESILSHIADSHYWHLWGDVSMPLPMIIYTDKGTEFFSSSVFHHGEDAYQGKYYTYKLINDKVRVVNEAGDVDKEASYRIYDFSITKNVVSLWISGILLLIIFISVASAYKRRAGKAPKGLQSFIEPIIIFVRDEIARPNIGYKYQKYMPFLLTIFFFIWINNIMGLIPIFPGGANVTGNIMLTFVLSFIVLLVVNFSGNKYYWKHILKPDVPLWLIFPQVTLSY